MVAPNHRDHGSFSATTIVPTFDGGGGSLWKPKKKVLPGSEKAGGILRSVIMVASILHTFKMNIHCHFDPEPWIRIDG